MTKRRERSPKSDTGKGERKTPRTAGMEDKKFKKADSGEESDISANASKEIKKAGELARQKDMKKENELKDKLKYAKEMEELR
eukprot:9468297-Heterocapsa_arctica.AAC.1